MHLHERNICQTEGSHCRALQHFADNEFAFNKSIYRAASYTLLGSNFGGYFDSANALGGPITMIQATVASLVISSGCIAFSDVVADGIVVQRTRDSDDPKVAGGLQSLCWGSVSAMSCDVCW